MIAIDTNVLVYAIDRMDRAKWRKARDLLSRLRAGDEPAVLPWQVAVEFLAYLRRRVQAGRLTEAALRRYLAVSRRSFLIVSPTEAVLDRALDLTGRYSLSHWDSLLVAACLEAGVGTLYSEDMGSPAVLDGLHVVNPFSGSP